MQDSLYTLKLRDKASYQINEIYSWYEEQQQDLGERFATAIQEKLSK